MYLCKIKYNFTTYLLRMRPRGLRRGSEAARLVGLWARIPPGACMSVSSKCCVLSGIGSCIRLITRPQEACSLRCVWMSSWSKDNEEALTHYGVVARGGRGVNSSGQRPMTVLFEHGRKGRVPSNVENTCILFVMIDLLPRLQSVGYL